MKKFNLKASNKRCAEYRKRILEISQKVSALHVGGSFSSTEIIEVIFNYFMNKEEKKCFILSKGHASILQYVVLEPNDIYQEIHYILCVTSSSVQLPFRAFHR